MAGYDKTKPSRNDSYINVLDDVRAKDDALAVMFNGVSLTDIPVNAVNFSGGVFGLWNGSSFVTTPVAIGGGGTGATTAAGARTALGVTSTTDLAAGYLSKAGNFSGLTDKPAARTELDVYGKSETYSQAEVNTRTPDASTSVKGLVQLNNTLTSTSTTLALTAAQGKVLNDKVVAGNTPQLIWQPAGAAENNVTDAEILADSGFVVKPGIYFLVSDSGDKYTVPVLSISGNSFGTCQVSVLTLNLSVTAGRRSSNSFQITQRVNGSSGDIGPDIAEIYFTTL